MADSLIHQALIQGTNNHSICNQAVGQDTLQDQPLVEAKALIEVQEVDPSMVRDTQVEQEDLNQETSVANEVDLVGPQLQLPDPVTNTIGKRKQVNMMMGTTKRNRNR